MGGRHEGRGRGRGRAVAVATAPTPPSAPLAPQAILFEGPPGTGKTTFAQQAARLASATLVYVPLESVGSRWYGESEKLLSAVFRHARSLCRYRYGRDEEGGGGGGAAGGGGAGGGGGGAGGGDGRGTDGSGPEGKGVILFLDEIDAFATSRDFGTRTLRHGHPLAPACATPLHARSPLSCTHAPSPLAQRQAQPTAHCPLPTAQHTYRYAA
jgi:DNA polymerase III delta prime subunit